MGQYWQIINLDDKTVLPKEYRKLGEFLPYPGVPGVLERFLAIPVRPNILDEVPVEIRIQAPTTPDSLARLPPEIHHLILGFCDDGDTDSLVRLLCLGFTSRYFWALAKGHIARHLAARLSAWAGKRLICAGDYIDEGDFPDGLFQHEQGGLTPTSFWDIVGGDDLFDMQPEKRISDKIRIAEEAVRAMLPAEEREREPSRGLGSWMLSLVDKARVYPDGDWILRNLTTREYVCARAFDQEAQGPFLINDGLGTAVLSRICWSSDGSISMCDYSGRITRGVWAGHCFDITTLDRHEAAKGKAWKDVSDEVVDQVCNMWDQNFGRFPSGTLYNYGN